MNRKQIPNMPAGNRSMAYAPPPPQLPQYLQSQQFNSSSNGSQESFTTQVPNSYHAGDSSSSGGSYAVQDYAYNAYIPAGSAPLPFATPELLSNGTFVSFGQNRSMNPNSAEFRPNGLGSNTNADVFAGSNSLNTSFGSTASSGYQSAASSGFATQIGNSSTYGGAPSHAAAPQYQNDYGLIAAGSATTDPYAQYNYAGSNSDFDSYNSGMQAFNPQPPSSVGYSIGGNGMQSANGYQNEYSYAVQPPQTYTDPSNINRGKPAAQYSGRNYNNNFYARNRGPSNLGVAPVRSANSATQNLAPQHQGGHGHGGPVRPPSAVQPPSPSKSRASERSQSQVSSNTRSDAKTPAPVNRQVEFKSEPRGADTPTPALRSRRGQDISTDPSRHAHTASWLEGVSNGGGGSGESQMFRGSPPKMDMARLSLNDNATESPSQAHGVDPFITTPAKRPYKNPFGQASLSPFTPTGTVTKKSGPSIELLTLTAGGTRKPTLVEALKTQNLPLVEYCRSAKEDINGVIKIKNIPYSVNRPEILAFLGRNARIISDTEFEPVHIVMERVTSKTLDAYVEFVNFNEAVNAVNRFEINRSGGRGGRLGQRHVEVELSSQEALMKDLFPKAKNVQWRGSHPVIIERDPNDRYNSGFQGFISKEELVMLVKHVEAPQRSPFSKDCPQRPFECIISTLLKYPWYMVDHITIEDRNLLHEATIKLICLLQDKLAEDDHDINITPMLLKRVWKAALKCAGFSPSQKDDIAVVAGLDDRMAVEYGIPPYAAEWKYMFTIGPKPGVPFDMVYYYAALIREATEKKQQHMSLAEKAAKGIEDTKPKLFGDLGSYVQLPQDKEEFIHMTLGQVAAKEWSGIEEVLGQTLEPGEEK